MKISVVTYNRKLSPEIVNGKIVIVIDVFRATSVIVTAIENGIKNIFIKTSVNEARKKSKNLGRENCILSGERKMKKISGFDFGNSPIPFLNQELKTKNLILTTTNGTAAINFSKNASSLYIGSFLNAKAVSDKIKDSNEDIVFICSGTRNQFSLEDSLCAGMIINYLYEDLDIEKENGDFVNLLRCFYKKNKFNKNKILEKSLAYKNLYQLGFSYDLEFCLLENQYRSIPKLKKCLGENVITR